MVMDLINRLCFFVGIAVGPAGWLCFFVSAAIGLAIDRAVLTGREIAIGFFELSLW